MAGDPDMIKDIFVRDWHVFADRTTGKKSGDPVFDNFLTVKSGRQSTMDSVIKTKSLQVMSGNACAA